MKVFTKLHGAGPINTVERTIKVGFPTAKWIVYSCKLSHADWIADLIATEIDPFWIVDPDVIFYASMGDIKPITCFSGMYIPRHRCPYIGAEVAPRLHPSVMLINPLAFRDHDARLHGRGHKKPLICCQPISLGETFYDTMALATYNLPCIPFDDDILDRYFHFFFGSHEDNIYGALPADEAADIKAFRNAILADPSRGRGAWRAQMDYFDKH